MEQLHRAVHAAEVAQVPVIGHVQLIAEIQERQHPLLFLVVLDHRRHRLVLVHQRADPAAEPAIPAAGRAGIHYQRALPVGRRALVHGEQLLVGVAPRVGALHQEGPHIVVGPVVDRRVDEAVRQRVVRAQQVPDASGFQRRHPVRRGPSSRLCGFRAPGSPRRGSGPSRG